ncbi:MAG: CoA-binding protein, partial [Ignavibacteria bacterium]
ILQKYNKIAVIGFSDNPSRDSNKIAFYMLSKGYTVYGVNPKLEGQNINGIQCFKSIKDIPEQIEIVDIFRISIAVLPIVQEILKLNYRPKVIWTQFGIINADAKMLAIENGFEYIEDKCIFIEHSKL